MARLTDLLGNRELVKEQQLERGRIFVFSEGNMYTSFCNCVCWRPPGVGCVVIDVWGASGSGAKMCCCGSGIPGNPGSFARKCICVCPDNYIYAYIGRSCNNSDALCFRGCSESTCVCWFGCAPYPLARYPEMWNDCRSGGRQGGRCNIPCIDPSIGVCQAAGATTGCICAQGGRGGVTYCQTDNFPRGMQLHCWGTNGWCAQKIGGADGCLLVCNYCFNEGRFCAYGGDINCCGGFSCTSFLGCLPNCTCQFQYHVKTSPFVFSEEGAQFTYTPPNDEPTTKWAGGTAYAHLNALAQVSRSPQGNNYQTCWGALWSCGCYNMQGCHPFNPYGVPGWAPQPCPNVRDHAGRGGMGALRIKYIGTNSYCAYSSDTP